MSDIEIGLLAWAITATIASAYYYAGREKDKLILSMTIHAMKEVARGNAKAWIDNQNNLRIKAYDTQGN